MENIVCVATDKYPIQQGVRVGRHHNEIGIQTSLQMQNFQIWLAEFYGTVIRCM